MQLVIIIRGKFKFYLLKRWYTWDAELKSGVTADENPHRIWIATKKSLLKRGPGGATIWHNCILYYMKIVGIDTEKIVCKNEDMIKEMAPQ